MDSGKFLSINFIAALCLGLPMPQTAAAMYLQGHIANYIPIPHVAPIKISQPRALPSPSVAPDQLLRSGTKSSSVKGIGIGDKIACNVTFFRGANGTTNARFDQAGWTEAKPDLVSYINNKAQANRTDYYHRENLQRTWVARSQDRFVQLSPNSITSGSFVEQYIKGQLSGHYRTTSVLSKLATRDVQ
jgi:hypothetical protein